MDQNKLKVLKDIRYRIVESCKTCKYSNLSSDGWGTCNLYEYLHKKHKKVMNLSINENGYCGSYRKDPDKLNFLESFLEFAK